MLLPEQNVVETLRKPNGVLEKSQMLFGNAKSLAQFSAYRFFSLALPYIYSPLDDQPLLAFEQEIQQHVPFYHHKFARPIFRIPEDADSISDLDRVLWAVTADVWPRFESYMLSVILSHSPTRAIYHFGAQDLLIDDPLAPVVSATDAGVPIVVFGVGSNLGVTAIDLEGSPGPQNIRRARHYDPHPGMTAFARLYFDREDPVAAQQALDAAKDAAKDALAVTKPQPGPIDFRVRPLYELEESAQGQYKQAIAEYQRMVSRGTAH